MRLALIGRNSFIARHVHKCAQAQGIEVTALAHDAPSDAVQGMDTVVNFSIDPSWFSQAYRTDRDCDLRAARAAAHAGAHFVMCSTRRVYPDHARFPGREGTPANGDETVYGRNKAVSESAVLAAANGACTILRLSNISGPEHGITGRRQGFFAQMLASLHRDGVIRFDMSPATRRDFLPVEICAQGILLAARDRPAATLNLGSGTPTRCGNLAQWIMEGFGRGTLVVTDNTARDEFFLDMAVWRSHFPRFPLPDENALKDLCINLGRELRDA